LVRICCLQRLSGILIPRIGFIMKRILVFLLSLNLYSCTHATTYYVATSGSDLTGNGSAKMPWASLHHASSSVTTPGDIIHLAAGTYTETLKSVLPPGVSLQGDGISTIVHLTFYDSTIHDAALCLTSPKEGMDGSQTISNIWFDGSNDACYIGVLVRCRSNVIIHDCKFTGFSHGAVFFDGKLEGQRVAPAVYSTGNQFYNNTVLDCMRGHLDREPGWGSLALAGQGDFLLHDNYLANNGRPTGQNGDIVGMVEGWNANLTMYNNTLIKPNIDEGNSNNMMIESWRDQGNMHVYNNIFQGGGCAIDIAQEGANRGSLGYSWYIDSNLFTMPVQYAKFPTEVWSSAPMGINVETENPNGGYIVIEKNHFHKLGVALQFSLNHTTTEIVRNVIFAENLCDSLGYTDGSGFGFINFINTKGASIDSVAIDNNTFIGWHIKAGIFFNMASASAGNDVDTLFLRNNFINGVTGSSSSAYGYLTYFGNKNISHFYVQNNFAHGNAQQNSVYSAKFTGKVTNSSITAPATSDPAFDEKFRLAAGSPAIGAGVEVGHGKDVGAHSFIDSH